MSEMMQMSPREHDPAKEIDLQLLRRIDAGDPDYATEHLTASGLQHLSNLESAGYVRVEGQSIIVTTSGLAALMAGYSFGYACELSALRAIASTRQPV